MDRNVSFEQLAIEEEGENCERYAVEGTGRTCGYICKHHIRMDRTLHHEIIIITIIHLLGLAPAGCFASPDNGPQAWNRGSATKLRTLCY
jgi:hypothetical protein